MYSIIEAKPMISNRTRWSHTSNQIFDLGFWFCVTEDPIRCPNSTILLYNGSVSVYSSSVSTALQQSTESEITNHKVKRNARNHACWS